jgi:hypothetical protein
MRYFSNNVTDVVEIRRYGCYSPRTPQGLKGLAAVAHRLSTFFERPAQEVLAEIIKAIEHGNGDQDRYLQATSFPPSEANAIWGVVRVLLATDDFEDKFRGIERSQAILCDLNRGLAVLVLTKVDYEGFFYDFDLTRLVF